MASGLYSRTQTGEIGDRVCGVWAKGVFIKKNWFGLESSCKQARSPDILEILASLSAMAHSPDPGCSMVAPKRMLQAELKSFLSE